MPRGRPKKVTTEVKKTIDVGANHDSPASEKIDAPVSKKQKYIFGLGRRKEAVARVFLYEEKNGPFTVNGQTFEEYFRGNFFGTPHLEPFKLTENLGKYKVDVKVEGSGKKAQIGAIILGISRALLIIDKEKFRPLLKKNNLLTRDSRTRERRKVGTGGRARRQKQSPKR